MPLASSFKLGTKKGREVSVQPVVDRPTGKVRFTIVDGPAPEPTKLGRGAHFRCLACDEVADEAYIKAEASAARMGSTLMAVVAEGHRKRIYVAPEGVSLPEIERVDAEWLEAPMPNNPRWFSPPGFGLTTYDRLFTDRQLLALTTLAELVQEVRGEIVRDAEASGRALADGQRETYADTIATYLGLAVSRTTDYSSTISTWASNPQMEIIRGAFARQALAMTWDFAEANIFGNSTGRFHDARRVGR